MSISTEAKTLSRSRSDDTSQFSTTISLRTRQQEGERAQEERGVSQIDDVLKLLKLDEGVEKLATNPNLKTFMDFWGRYAIQNPGNGAIQSATAAYGDDVVATILQTARKVSGTKLLKLDDAASNPLSNPALDAWASYLILFNYANPGKETTMIKVFTKAYGDEALAKMLLSGKEVAAMENLARYLQLAQFVRWMRKGQNPDKVYLHVFKLDPKLTTISEPYKTILNQYHRFYKLNV
ncbi:hypothetical protein P3T76_007815 [Phytophthora citrophthora]|uniref:RxLR effector protein n=1 Tax=Phytophthora citrophthora TaxID=4793 RepID=A0AAD9LNF7_9STRA|nr:hypothetical protein P3T76_007815 [Phytophthora citrophthora]